jgi:hypothetical protein
MLSWGHHAPEAERPRAWPRQFWDAGMNIRRLLHWAAADHSLKEIATVGKELLDQKLPQGTEFVAHPCPLEPHSQVGAPVWTRLTS